MRKRLLSKEIFISFFYRYLESFLGFYFFWDGSFRKFYIKKKTESPLGSLQKENFFGDILNYTFEVYPSSLRILSRFLSVNFSDSEWYFLVDPSRHSYEIFTDVITFVYDIFFCFLYNLSGITQLSIHKFCINVHLECIQLGCHKFQFSPMSTPSPSENYGRNSIFWGGPQTNYSRNFKNYGEISP